jgi:hypothetical protein
MLQQLTYLENAKGTGLRTREKPSYIVQITVVVSFIR